MKRHHPRARGFTLIELLIAITLFAAITAGLLITLRTGLLTLERTSLRLEDNRRAVNTLEMIRRQIGGAMPARGYCQAGEAIGLRDVFRGNASTLMLATIESIAEGSRGYPRVAIYRFLQNPDRTVRLELEEHLFSGLYSTVPLCELGSPAFPPPGPGSVVLLDGLAYGRFVYRSRDLYLPPEREWLPQWEIFDTPPRTVRLEMESAPGTASRMPLGAITIPLRMTLDRRAEYKSEP